MTCELVWKAEDIIRAVHGQCLQEQNWVANGVSIDSRSVSRGDVFVALKGPSFDGHEFVGDALSAGAVAAIVDRRPARAPQHAPLILVENSFKALEALGRAGRKRSHAKVIAVTGSVGKTGTKDMLRLMLNEVGNVYPSEGGLNNHWGLPLSLARLPQGSLYGVFELGMNHAGELGPLSQMTRPDVALITTIEAVHLEFFETLDAIADAKAEIFRGMAASGAAVLNRDNDYYARLAQAAKAQGLKRILGFGQDSRADGRLIDITADKDGSSISGEILGRKLKYRLGAKGRHLALNSVGALTAAAAAGADLDACSAILAHYRPPSGRGVVETIALEDGSLTLLDESYNASPVAVRAAIAILTDVDDARRRVLVLGDMKELGKSSPYLHAGLAKDILGSKIDLVFCCGPMMKLLFDALPARLQGGFAPNAAEMAPLVASAARSGDAVTIKGSNSMKMSLVTDALKARSRQGGIGKRAS